MAVLDQSGGNPNAQFETKPHERPVKAYPWTCTNPGCPSPAQIGRIEDGCAACGAGADGIQGEPLKPTDFNCQACRGTGTVERKCGICDGTGYTDAPQLGEPPPACEKCGGAGTIALGCGRCDGSGIDPAPAQTPVAKAEDTSPEPPVALAASKPEAPSWYGELQRNLAMAEVRAKGQEILMGKQPLPSIDEDKGLVTSPDTVVRYRLIRYSGSAPAIDAVIARSLQGVWLEGSYDIAAIEIAEPKSTAVKNAIDHATAESRWPAREKY